MSLLGTIFTEHPTQQQEPVLTDRYPVGLVCSCRGALSSPWEVGGEQGQ